MMTRWKIQTILAVLLLTLTITTTQLKADPTVYPVGLLMAGALSVGTYEVCRNAGFGKAPCAFSGLVLSNLIMIADLDTYGTNQDFNTKMRSHFYGSSIVIPLAIFDGRKK